ncbi:hypothetical protein KAM484_17950 [Aeromonas caviae]|nr:hypothetical protein KAM467_10620 [Aeromonas caviae]GKR51854.1 hypothetical protein KAM475_10010 [Aeromonas caviae]GKR90990.1 hypothetical protein KAM484_17950 [Aeromonas caviae]
MLLSRLDTLTSISTPSRTLPFGNERRQVSERRSGIIVRHVPQATSQGTAAGLFQVVNSPKHHLALHFPAVEDPLTPHWLDQFVAQHPGCGVLAVDYAEFAWHLNSDERPEGMDTISWVFTLLSQQSSCLSWIYHPHDQHKLAQWQAEKLAREQQEAERQAQWQQELEARQREERAKQDRIWAWRKKQKQERLERERRARDPVELQRMKEEALLREEREQSLMDRAPPDAAPTVTPQPQGSMSLGYCRYCRLPPNNSGLDEQGFCYREICVQSRSPKPASVATSRYQYGQARYASRHWTDWAEDPDPPRDRSNDCPHCGGDKGKGVRGWWCEHCEPNG